MTASCMKDSWMGWDNVWTRITGPRLSGQGVDGLEGFRPLESLEGCDSFDSLEGFMAWGSSGGKAPLVIFSRAGARAGARAGTVPAADPAVDDAAALLQRFDGASERGEGAGDDGLARRVDGSDADIAIG